MAVHRYLVWRLCREPWKVGRRQQLSRSWAEISVSTIKGPRASTTVLVLVGDVHQLTRWLARGERHANRGRGNRRRGDEIVGADVDESVAQLGLLS